MTTKTHTSLTAFLTAITVMLVAVWVGVPRANAEVTVGAPVISTINNGHGSDETGALYQYSDINVAFPWEAGAEGVTEGETFDVVFPSELQLYPVDPFELEDTNGVAGATCVVKQPGNSATCTFNEAYVNRDQVKGTVVFVAQATQLTNKTTTTFEINGTAINVAFPGSGKGIVAPKISVGTWKGAWIQPDNRFIGWELQITGADLAALAPNGEPVTVVDTLTGPQRHVESTPRSNTEFISNLASDSPENRHWFANPWDTEDPGNTTHFLHKEATVSNDGKTKTFTLYPNQRWSDTPTEWDPNRLYRLFYYAEYTGDGQIPQVAENINTNIDPNETDWLFGNSAVFGDSTKKDIVFRSARGSGTITGVPRGSFAISKQLAEGSVQLPSGTLFTVNVEVDSPKDAFDSTYTIEVPLNGQAVTGDTLLPAGSIVTLSEPELPTIKGYTFGTPKFAAAVEGDPNVKISADGSVATLTMQSDSNVAVTLFNTVEKEEVPPSTPTDPPPVEPQPEEGLSSIEGSSYMARCVEATSSMSNQLAWLIPLGLMIILGGTVGNVAAPYVNKILGSINGEIASNSPDLGIGGVSVETPEWLAEINATVAAANQQLGQIHPAVGPALIGGALIAAGLAATQVAWDICGIQGHLGSSVGDGAGASSTGSSANSEDPSTD